jgi:hypothetical protein
MSVSRQFFLQLVVALALGSSAGAIPATYTGTLRLVLGSEADASAVFDLSTAGAGAAEIGFSGGVIDSLTFGAGGFSLASGPLAVTDPDAVPITAVDVAAATGAASFGSLASGGGGTLLVDGSFAIAILGGPIDYPNAFLLSQAGEGVGVGGIIAPAGGGALLPVLTSNPWSVGSVTSGSTTISGATSADRVVLVTAFRYESTSFTTAFGYAVLDVELAPIPEPGTAALAGWGLALLGLARWRRARSV